MVLSDHLSVKDKIDLGSFYTPDHLVKIAISYIQKYLDKDNVVLCDFAAGKGAFINPIQKYNYKAYDIDPNAVEYLKNNFDKEHIFLQNSLLNVSRSNFSLSNDDFVISIGNPPYNDTTSLNKKGVKSTELLCDEDLKSRDLGISFLKMYDKLQVDCVCVLHPLSYLVKKTNFNLCEPFVSNYKLIDGLIFSSTEFEDNSKTQFPILIGLYEKNLYGMDYEYIRNFEFKVINSKLSFRLSRYTTTDGFIHKYPTKESNGFLDLNIYFQTFRDFNSLKRNASFLIQKSSSTINISLDDFYKYSYLHCLKKYFAPKEPFLFGNLSPLVNDLNFSDEFKRICISLAFETSNDLTKYKNMFPDEYTQIISHYGIEFDEIRKNEEVFIEYLDSMIKR